MNIYSTWYILGDLNWTSLSFISTQNHFLRSVFFYRSPQVTQRKLHIILQASTPRRPVTPDLPTPWEFWLATAPSEALNYTTVKWSERTSHLFAWSTKCVYILPVPWHGSAHGLNEGWFSYITHVPGKKGKENQKTQLSKGCIPPLWYFRSNASRN